MEFYLVILGLATVTVVLAIFIKTYRSPSEKAFDKVCEIHRQIIASAEKVLAERISGSWEHALDIYYNPGKYPIAWDEIRTNMIRVMSGESVHVIGTDDSIRVDPRNGDIMGGDGRLNIGKVRSTNKVHFDVL